MPRRRGRSLHRLALLLPLLAAGPVRGAEPAAAPTDEAKNDEAAPTHGALPDPDAAGGPSSILARAWGAVPVDRLMPVGRRRTSLMGPDALGSDGGRGRGSDRRAADPAPVPAAVAAGKPQAHAVAAGAAVPAGIVTSAALQTGLATVVAGEVREVVLTTRPARQAAAPRAQAAGPPPFPAMEGRLPAGGDGGPGTPAAAAAAAHVKADKQAQAGPAGDDGGDPPHHRAAAPNQAWATGSGGNWSAPHHDPFYDAYGGAAAAWAADAAGEDDDGGADGGGGAFHGDGDSGGEDGFNDDDGAYDDDGDDDGWEDDDPFYDPLLDELDPWAGVGGDGGGGAGAGADGDSRGAAPWDEL